jgi:hypothetical protein
MKKILIPVVLGTLGFASCGASTTSTSSFKVRMHGIHSPPPGAEGTSAPQSQIYLFKGVTLLTEDGTALPLYDGDPTSVKIIDRGQIVFEKNDMSEYDGTEISSVNVEFDPTILITSKDNDTTSFEMSSGNLTLNEGFKVKKNKEQVVTIKVAWGDTLDVDDDGNQVISAPSLTVIYDDGD